MFGKWTFRIVSELNMTMVWEGDVGRYQYERSEGVKNEGGSGAQKESILFVLFSVAQPRKMSMF